MKLVESHLGGKVSDYLDVSILEGDINASISIECNQFPISPVFSDAKLLSPSPWLRYSISNVTPNHHRGRYSQIGKCRPFRRQCPHSLASQRLENVGNRLIFCVYPWLAQELVSLIFSPPVCVGLDGAKATRCQVCATIISLGDEFPGWKWICEDLQ